MLINHRLALTCNIISELQSFITSRLNEGEELWSASSDDNLELFFCKFQRDKKINFDTVEQTILSVAEDVIKEHLYAVSDAGGSLTDAIYDTGNLESLICEELKSLFSNTVSVSLTLNTDISLTSEVVDLIAANVEVATRSVLPTIQSVVSSSSVATFSIEDVSANQVLDSSCPHMANRLNSLINNGEATVREEQDAGTLTTDSDVSLVAVSDTAQQAFSNQQDALDAICTLKKSGHHEFAKRLEEVFESVLIHSEI
ncbi:hypothetical protein VCHA53O466_50210 [Vibrio chagasii]|nr:hypothetical protein VCHA53O466_50210 [Vibrio chagasii]